MHTYREETVVKKVIDLTLCNCCGKEAVVCEQNENVDRYWDCKIDVIWRSCGSFPGQQLGTIHYDICHNCFEKKIKPLMIALPANEVLTDRDNLTTTIKP